MTESLPALLQGDLREVRALGGSESPWPGMLVREAGGALRIAVDAADLGAEWPGWSLDGEHLLAPVEVVRTAEGHCALMPTCIEPLAAFLVRRGEHALGPGEIVTLAVSVLRGAREADGRHGCWWVAADGRPVLAIGAEPEEPATAPLAALPVPASLAAVWTTVEAVRGGAELSCDDERWEQAELALFAAAEPAPLAVAGPSAVPMAVPAPSPSPRDTWFAHAVRHVDVELAELVSRGTTGLWHLLRRDSSPQRTRRRAWATAGAVAAVVLVLGVLWPGEEKTGQGPVAAASASPAAAGTPIPTAAPAAVDGGVAPDVGDLAAVADALLTARTRCAGERGCLSEVAADPEVEFPSGAIDLPASQRTVVLVDDYGGAAVVRVQPTADGAPAQYVAIVAQDGEWLLRDAYDVAQQP
ncbi:hypothetical protein ACFQRL_05035 [Microbacterium fluvii]|uniref:Uncharacterized protein n=1 Tax=Microbacterium fluvii TaxID=415215 RepID=A0ABW2HF40_9MICO|nr:hypothetical protein [Microbacterium fluvii]MCU4671954.1 hypothetical protein [Microbacterium fluvii]